MDRRFVTASILALAFGPASAVGQTPSAAPAVSVVAFDTVFRDWMKEHSVEKGALVIGLKDRQVFERGYGGQDPTQRLLLASLSKAITARCIAVLVADGKLQLDSRVGAVLAPFFRQHGEPADPRIKDATVEQLLTHRAGFSPAPRDLMTPAAVELLQTSKSPATASPAELLAATLTGPLAAAPGEGFRYSNIGYLTLGVMIEQASGESYERFCGREVLEWSRIDGPALDRTWRAFSSFGGWSLSGAAYGAFLRRDRLHDLLSARAGDPAHTERTAALTAVALDPQRRHAATGAPGRWTPVWYGFGQFATVFGSEPRVAWHTGSWGVAPDTVGMQAAQHQRGASWFAWYAPRPSKEATDALLERFTALAGKLVAPP
ncbi:MAG TPA: serine hydrolase domain-containing protein [Vineibacter sp.]|nr:serine hydrolase domain-containing protein [Vineibacter sp.]